MADSRRCDSREDDESLFTIITQTSTRSRRCGLNLYAISRVRYSVRKRHSGGCRLRLRDAEEVVLDITHNARMCFGSRTI